MSISQRAGTAPNGRDFKPKPPDLRDMPVCAQCVREGGITLYGRRHAPQRAALHPLHEHARSEPICYLHAELAAWTARPREAQDAPMPVWTRAATPSQAATVEEVLAKFTAHRKPKEDPYRTRVALSREMYADREPGEEG